MRKLFGCLIAMGVLSAWVAPAPAQTQRHAVPDAEAVAAATAQIETTYADDLKNSVKPQDQVFLSQKLQLLAGNVQDNARCYAMLAKAKDLAIPGGSFEQAASVIDAVNDRFDVDGPALKWDAAAAVAKTAGTDQRGELMAGVNKLAKDAMGLDRYDVAESAAQWCKDAAPPGDVAAQALVDQIQETQSAYEAIKPALATLASDPHNADANTSVGKFKCFFKGDWNGGLAMLAAGSDAGLKGLATDDLSGTTSADALAKLGDGWWDVAQQQNGMARDKIQLHAAAIYAEASAGLGGLDQAKADGRVQEAMAMHAKMSGTTALATSPPSPAPGPPPAPDTISGPGPAPANVAGVKEVTNSVGMKLAWIKPGTFVMGSPEDEKGHTANESQHKVTLTKGFFMGTTHVTFGQFAEFVHETGYKTEAEIQGAAGDEIGKWHNVKGESWRKPGFAQGDDHPAVCTSWTDSVAFCKWLSKKEGKLYRLPTEAEWEYAARARTQTAYYFGDAGGSLGDYAWMEHNSGNQTHPVGQKNPNAWGLYDMTGNAWEWCSDFYGNYPDGVVTDPRGPGEGQFHVLRGGSWHNGSSECRSAYHALRKYGCNNSVGFRVVMDGD